MRKWALLGAVALAAVTAGPALAGNSSGGGAQKSQLTFEGANSGGSDCPQGAATSSSAGT